MWKAIASFFQSLFSKQKSQPVRKHGGIVNVPSTIGQWQTVHIGGGGFNTGIDLVTSDNTTLSRVDIFGLYKLNRSNNTWTSILNSSSLAGLPSLISDYNYQGVIACAIAPSNTSRMYTYWTQAFGNNGTMLRSDDGGNTWSQPDGGTLNISFSGQFPTNRQAGFFLRVDPNNPDVAIFGTPSNGIYYTTNKGATWTALSGSWGAGGTPIIVCFDQFSPVSGGQTQVIYVTLPGTGVFQSTTGLTGTFNQLTGTNAPNGTQIRMKCFRNTGSGNGDLFVAQVSSTTIRKFPAGSATNATWTLLDPTNGAGGSTVSSFSFDPTTSGGSQRIAAINNGNFFGAQISISNNYGSTWGGYQSFTYDSSNGVPGWMQYTQQTNQMSIDNAEYDSNGLLWMANGVGVWTTTPNAASSNVYKCVSGGIENMRAACVIAPPGGGPVIFGVRDKQFTTISKANIKAGNYPPQYGNYNETLTQYQGTILHGWGFDWDKTNPSNLSMYMASQGFSGVQAGTSTDGGVNWNVGSFQGTAVGGFSHLPGNSFGSGISIQGGMICSSTRDKVTIIQAGVGGLLYNSQNASSASDSWTNPTITGISTGAGDNGWGGGEATSSDVRKILCADTKQANYQYAYNYGGNSTAGTYRSTDGGQTWASVNSSNLNNGVSGDDKNQSTLICDPNLAGHLLFCSGGASDGSNTALYECTNGNTGSPPITWTKVSVANGYGFDIAPSFVAFGCPKPGRSNSTIFISGIISSFSSVPGIYRSDDGMQTWANLGNYPANIVDFPVCLTGDLDVYGACYLGFSGSTYVWRTGP